MPPDDAVRLEAHVRGRVQGVGFRWFVREAAERLGLVGWVANERDGSVRVVAEGGPAGVDQLVEDLHRGPRGATVAQVDVRRTEPTGEFDGFGIRSGWHAGD